MANQILKLLFGVVGIYLCYLRYGIDQETLYHYKDKKGVKFSSTSVILGIQTLFSLVFGIILNFIYRPKSEPVKTLSNELKGVYLTAKREDSVEISGKVKDVRKEVVVLESSEGVQSYIPLSSPYQFFKSRCNIFQFLLPSVAYLAAMKFSNMSLTHVSYPTEVLVKSTKMIPVMLMGVVINRTRYSLTEYIRVFLVATGIVIFNLYSKSFASSRSNDLIGYLFLTISLFADGIVGPLEDRIKTHSVVTSPDIIIGLNIWSVLFNIIILAYNGELLTFYPYLRKNPQLFRIIIEMSILSSLGQFCIIYTVNNFNSLVASIVTTTRKFFTILISVVLFNHALKTEQHVGVVLVFFALGWELFDKYTKSRRLSDSKKTDDPKAEDDSGAAHQNDIRGEAGGNDDDDIDKDKEKETKKDNKQSKKDKTNQLNQVNKIKNKNNEKKDTKNKKK